MRYFIQKIHSSPNTLTELGFRKIDDNLYCNDLDGSLWKPRELANMGWGRECGLYRLPELDFKQLISLVFISPVPEKAKWYHKKTKEKIKCEKDNYYNFWGSLAVLVYDHCDEFIEYIFCNFTPEQLAKEYPDIYDYTNSELNLPASFCDKISDKSFVICCEKWKNWVTGTNHGNFA